MARAIWNGAVIAQSDACELVEGNVYFPPEALKREHLTPSATRSHCGWKGEAHYYTLEVGGKTNPDAAWFYPDPLPKARHIQNHVAFWRGVTVER